MNEPAISAYRRTAVVHPVPVADDEVRARFCELLGLLDVPGADSVSVELGEDETGADGVSVTPLRFRNELDEIVPCILMRPAGASGALGGIVCMPGTGGDADLISEERLQRPLRHRGPLHGWARELARRGFATLAVTLRGTTARQPNPMERERESKAMEPFGRTAVGLRVREALQAARVLGAADGVSADRIGLTGFSLGGQAAWQAQAGAPSLRASAPLAGSVGSMAAVIREGDLDRHSSPFYIPHLLRHFDQGRIARVCICPRPLMVLAPTEDEDMPASGVDEMEREVRQAYASAGCAHRFEVHRPHLNHLFLPEHLDSVTAFFGRWLS
ncbi:MAG: dienelactone hydrolase family protein [Spirochaetaceae bacterium]|nr:dienelactone hydrolase family protein [Spirochaetaceae bacterium]